MTSREFKAWLAMEVADFDCSPDGDDTAPYLFRDGEAELVVDAAWRVGDEFWRRQFDCIGYADAILGWSDDQLRGLLRETRTLRRNARRRQQERFVDELLAKVVVAAATAAGTDCIAISRFGEVQVTPYFNWRNQGFARTNRDWAGIPAYGFKASANRRLLKSALVERAKELDEPKGRWLGESRQEKEAVASW